MSALETTLPWQAVFFDFDGVIADSVQVKTTAFGQLFQPYGEKIVKQVIDFHLANGGMPRYQKFIYYYKELLGRKIEDQELKTLGEQFSALVLDGVIAAELIPGALESVQTLKEQQIPAFVVSGTPHDEMQIVVQKKGLAAYFTEVHGSPPTKTEIVSALLEKYALQAAQCLFIGDALADLKAAQNCGTAFLGIRSKSSPVSFPPGTPVSEVVRLTLP